MHDVLRQRLIRKIESLPEAQVYQVLDFIEFLESKYAERHLQAEASTLQRFAENVEDRMRRKAMNPATIREAFQLIAAADKVLSNVSAAGRQIVDELGTLGELPESGPGAAPGGSGRVGTGRPPAGGPPRPAPSGGGSAATDRGRGRGEAPPRRGAPDEAPDEPGRP